MTVYYLEKYLQAIESRIYQLANDQLFFGCLVGKSWRFKKDMINEKNRQEMETIHPGIRYSYYMESQPS